jgi:hypothetical protein
LQINRSNQIFGNIQKTDGLLALFCVVRQQSNKNTEQTIGGLFADAMWWHMLKIANMQH